MTECFTQRHGREYERITPKWIGTIIRKRLHLRTHKSSHGVFVISPEELKKLPTLYEIYGVMPVDSDGANILDNEWCTVFLRQDMAQGAWTNIVFTQGSVHKQAIGTTAAVR